MKQLILISAVLICSVCAKADVPTAEEILTKTLENVCNVHTARYNLTERLFYMPDDSLYICEKVSRVVECENPADTLGLPVYVRLDENGGLNSAIDSEYSFFGRVGYIEKSRRSAQAYKWPPFYNRVMHMCKYLLKPMDNITLTVIDCGDQWEIDAPVRGGKMIYFAGYPRVLEMSSDDICSHFGLRVDKSTMMPVWVSYLLNLPQSRFEESVSDVELNAFAPETFAVSDYFGDMSVYEGKEEREKYKEWRKKHFSEIEKASLPTDTLTLLDGTEVSLTDSKDRVKVVFFATTQCGVCRAAFPSMNRIYESYPADSVHMFGVMRETVAQPRAVLDALAKNDLHVPMALNNGSFYEYFYPNGLSPAVIVVDRKGRIALIQSGFNYMNPDETESRIRRAIDRALSDIDNP